MPKFQDWMDARRTAVVAAEKAHGGDLERAALAAGLESAQALKDAKKPSSKITIGPVRRIAAVAKLNDDELEDMEFVWILHKLRGKEGGPEGKAIADLFEEMIRAAATSKQRTVRSRLVLIWREHFAKTDERRGRGRAKRG